MTLGQEKINPAFLLDLVKFLLPVIFLAGVAWATFATKSEVSEEYVKKEVYQAERENASREREEIKRYLERIETKLDNHMNISK